MGVAWGHGPAPSVEGGCNKLGPCSWPLVPDSFTLRSYANKLWSYLPPRPFQIISHFNFPTCIDFTMNIGLTRCKEKTMYKEAKWLIIWDGGVSPVNRQCPVMTPPL